MTPNTLEPENFEKLMNWLGPDRDSAGRKYESIRARLVKIFYARGCHQAEEMADETMDRVTRKMSVLAETYKGDPALYFYAVAKNVWHEFTRAPKFSELPEHMTRTETSAADGQDDAFECLEKCLQEIPEDHRSFILRYYKGNKREKIERRKRLALESGVSDKALRIRAYRIRDVLRKCISDCMQTPFPA